MLILVVVLVAKLCQTLCDPMDSIAHQASLSMAQQEHWSGFPFPDPGTEPASLASPALAGGFFTTEPPGKCVC